MTKPSIDLLVEMLRIMIMLLQAKAMQYTWDVDADVQKHANHVKRSSMDCAAVGRSVHGVFASVCGDRRIPSVHLPGATCKMPLL